MSIINFLVFFTFLGLFFATSYLLYRHNYTKKIKETKEIYANKVDVIKPTSILITILILIYIVFFYVFYKVSFDIGQLELTNLTITMLLTYGFLFMLFAFSNGIYFYSILMEALVIKKIETSKQYIRAFHFIHGPVSHFLVYFCGGMIFILNGYFEYASSSTTTMTDWQMTYLAISGVIFGVMYFGGAVGSHAWQDQIITSILMVVIHFAFVAFLGIEYRSHPYNYFFAFASTVYCVLLLGYLARQTKLGERYKYAWDQ